MGVGTVLLLQSWSRRRKSLAFDENRRRDGASRAWQVPPDALQDRLTALREQVGATVLDPLSLSLRRPDEAKSPPVAPSLTPDDETPARQPPLPVKPQPGARVIYDSHRERNHHATEQSSLAWSELPTDNRVSIDAPFPYRGHVRGTTHQAVAVSVRGPGHFKSNLPCQDALRILMLNDGTVVAAVADGLGSARHSDVGARLAVDAATDFVLRQLEHGSLDGPALMQRALEATRARIHEFARSSGVSSSTLGSTLLIALVQGPRAFTGHAGDGAIVKRIDGQWTIASPPEDTLYVNYVTPVGCDRAPSTWQVYTHSRVEALALLSDGLERSAVRRKAKGYEVNEDFFRPLHAALADAPEPEAGARLLAETLDSLALRAANDDDKSLALIWTPPLRSH
ncbi:PP2C family serine/threonine-protein phosphatase [Plesiocystis pacifica]|nr:PP2C family serine/threonine-protein phosphatase [Plesiocystis pacifica]